MCCKEPCLVPTWENGKYVYKCINAALPGPLTGGGHPAPYPGWHCVWIDEMMDDWVVSCIPHGEIARKATHLAAMLAAVEHDPDNRSGHEEAL